jgi:glycerophosphoryl diester phosphodiesterase
MNTNQNPTQNLPLRTQNPFLLERLQAGPLRTAHGGASRLAPDNTLEAIILASAHPVDLVEIDLHLTRDGELLLWHDAQFITPYGIFPIAKHTLAELRALPLLDGTLATLEDAIETVQGRCGLMLDLKAEALEGPIVERLNKLAFFDVMVCGGYGNTLERIKLELPQVAVSRTPDMDFYLNMAARLPAAPHLDALTVYWRSVGPEMVALCRSTGTLLLAWTVDHPQFAHHLLELGINGLTSNSLEILAMIPKNTFKNTLKNTSSR